MRFALDHNQRGDFREIGGVVIDEGFDHDGGREWNLLAHREKDFLAHDFRRQHPLSLIGVLVAGHQRRACGQHRGDDAHQLVEVFTGERADRDDFCRGQDALRFISDRQEALTRDEIDLIDCNDHRAFQARKIGEELALLAPRDAARLDHGGDHFAFREASPRRIDHSAVERASGVVQAGSIDQDHLARGVGANPHDSAAGRLRLGRDDSDLLTNEAIEQRRFADVGAAGNRDEAGAMGIGAGQRRSCLVNDDPARSEPTLPARPPARSASCCRPHRRRARAR